MSERDTDPFQEAREVLENPLPGTDNADLIDYIDYLEENGYRGSMNLNPDARVEDVIFEVALHVGYACGLQDGGDDD